MLTASPVTLRLALPTLQVTLSARHIGISTRSRIKSPFPELQELEPSANLDLLQISCLRGAFDLCRTGNQSRPDLSPTCETRKCTEQEALGTDNTRSNIRSSSCFEGLCVLSSFA